MTLDERRPEDDGPESEDASAVAVDDMSATEEPPAGDDTPAEGTPPEDAAAPEGETPAAASAPEDAATAEEETPEEAEADLAAALGQPGDVDLVTERDLAAPPEEEEVTTNPLEALGRPGEHVAPPPEEVPEVVAATAPEAPAEEGDAEGVEVVDVEELLDGEGELEPQESPYDRPGKWFVVHTQSGYEKKVKQNLEARTVSMNMEDHIFEVVIPEEDVMEFKGGKKVVVKKKMFPGYLLVRCQLDDDSWYAIRNTPGITGFVGQGTKPSPLPRREVENFLQVKAEGTEAPKRTKPRLEYEPGETVRVKEGPFADFSGEVVEINEDQLKVKVLVNIFGRETPVELEFAQVAKL